MKGNNNIFEDDQPRNFKNKPYYNVQPDSSSGFYRSDRNFNHNNPFDYQSNAEYRDSIYASSLHGSQRNIDKMRPKSTYESSRLEDRNRIDIVISSPHRYVRTLRRPDTTIEQQDYWLRPAHKHRDDVKQSVHDQCTFVEGSDNDRYRIRLRNSFRQTPGQLRINNLHSMYRNSNSISNESYGRTNYGSGYVRELNRQKPGSHRRLISYSNENYNKGVKKDHPEIIDRAPASPRLSPEETSEIRHVPIEPSESLSEIPSVGGAKIKQDQFKDPIADSKRNSKELRDHEANKSNLDSGTLKIQGEKFTKDNTKDSNCSNNSKIIDEKQSTERNNTSKIGELVSPITGSPNNGNQTKSGCPLFSM